MIENFTEAFFFSTLVLNMKLADKAVFSMNSEANTICFALLFTTVFRQTVMMDADMRACMDTDVELDKSS